MIEFKIFPSSHRAHALEYKGLLNRKRPPVDFVTDLHPFQFLCAAISSFFMMAAQ